MMIQHTNYKLKRKLIFYGIVLAFLLVGSIAVTITAAAKGSEIAYLDHEKKVLMEENAELTAKIVESTSMTEIAQVSEKLGLIKPQEVIYLTKDVPVASLR